MFIKQLKYIVLGLAIFLSSSPLFAQTPSQFTESAQINATTIEAMPKEEHFFESYKEDPLKDFFIKAGLKVERPFWRKLDVTSPENNFLKVNESYEFPLTHSAEALIFEVFQVRDSDIFNLTIEDSEANKKVYHNVREILYTPVPAGTYKVSVQSNVFEFVGLKIYEADSIYPAGGLLLVNEDDFRPNFSDKLKAFISRGGVVINLASQNIHNGLQNMLTSLQEAKLAGKEAAITFAADYYFYIPKDLFTEEETAWRTLETLKTQLGVNDSNRAGITTLITIIFVLMLFYLLYKNRENIKAWTAQNLFISVEKWQF